MTPPLHMEFSICFVVFFWKLPLIFELCNLPISFHSTQTSSTELRSNRSRCMNTFIIISGSKYSKSIPIIVSEIGFLIHIFHIIKNHFITDLKFPLSLEYLKLEFLFHNITQQQQTRYFCLLHVWFVRYYCKCRLPFLFSKSNFFFNISSMTLISFLPSEH